MRDRINTFEQEKKKLLSESEKTLGSIATRLNVHATIHTMLCQITEESLANKVKANMSDNLDINEKNKLGYSALHIAAMNGHALAVNLLIEHSADLHNPVHDSGFSSLHCSVLGGNGEVIEALLQAGARLEYNDKNGCTLLHIAAKEGSTWVLDHICKHISSLENLDNYEVLSLLGKHKTDLLDATDKSGNTALHIAAVAGREKFVQALVEAGVDVHVKNKDGRSPLAMATNKTIKGQLRSVGAGGWTPLMIAAAQEKSPQQSQKDENKIEQLLRAINCWQCIQEKTEFPGWFQRLVCFRAALKEVDQESEWTWGGFEPKNLDCCDHRLTINKTSDNPDFSAAVGSTVLGYGIHRWELRVSNVCNMLAGIARGIEENNLMGKNPYELNTWNYPDIFALAISNTGSLFSLGKSCEFLENSTQRFYSNQIIGFELDTFMHTLSIKIDDRLVFFGAGIDDRNIRPYICMDYEEEVTLLSRKSLLVSISDTPKSVNTKELWIVDSNLASVDGAVLSRKRIADSPNAGASTLCTTKFNQGWVYTWSVQVKNVAKMYVGVAKGNTDSLIHNSPESPVEGDEVMAVRNDGGICNKTGWNCHINCINSPTFRSGQTLEVTVDMPEQCLSIRIDGVLYLMVHNADLADFQPYICSCGSEVVVLPYPSCQERFFFLDKSASWKWNESDFCEVTQETVMKKMGSHSYSGVVGSEELEEEGVHTWSIKVESNDQEIAQRLPMWVGIARHAEEQKVMDKPSTIASDNEKVHIVAFGSDGSTLGMNRTSGYTIFNSFEGVILKLKLDTLRSSLSLFIGEATTPEVTAFDVDCKCVRPYVCLPEKILIALGEKTFHYRSARSLAIENEDWMIGFDNVVWNMDINEKLIRHSFAGPSPQ